MISHFLDVHVDPNICGAHWYQNPSRLSIRVHLNRTNLNKLPLNILAQAAVVPAYDSTTQRVEAGGLP